MGAAAVGWFARVALALAGCCLPGIAPLRAQTLHPGQVLELELAPGDTLNLDVDIAPPQPLRISVDERGVDVDMQLVAAQQRWRAEDDDILRWGRQRIAVAAAQPGLRLELRAPRRGSPKGRVRILLEAVDLAVARNDFALDLSAAEIAQRMADPERIREPQTADMAAALCAARQAAGDKAGYVRCVGLQERILARQSRRPEAIAALRAALPAWRELADPRGEASALNNLGMHYHWLGDGREAGPPLQQALAALNGVRDDLLRAVIQNNICLSGALRASLDGAQRCYERVLALSQASGDGPRIATAQNNLGGAHLMQGDTAGATVLFEQAIAGWRQLDNLPGSADARANLGLARLAQGRLDEALAAFEDAGAAHRAGKNTAGEALMLRHRGHVQLMLGEPALALDLMQQALAVQRKGTRRNDVIATLGRLAEAQLAVGQAEAARASVREAVELAQKDDHPRVLADAWLSAARVYRAGGDSAAALDAARQAVAAAAALQQDGLGDVAALEVAEALLLAGDAALARQQAETALRSGRLNALHSVDAHTLLAAALHAQGRRPAAEAAYRRALQASAKAGSYIFDLEQRSTFLASQRAAQLGLIALLMDAGDKAGPPPRAAEALALSVDLRARSLREHLDAAGTATASSPEREAQVAQLAALALARWKLRGDSPQAASLRELDRQIRAAEDSLRRIDLALAPAGHAVPDARPATRIAALQQALPDDASLVVFRELPGTSYAWVLGRDSLQVARLPDRAQLAQAVQRVRDSLAAGADWDAPLRDACRQVWQPLAAWVATPRVLVVGDTALDALPFAALRCGAADDPAYLLEKHEFAFLPAAWLLLRPAAAPLAADFRALLVGDPVYSRDDARLAQLPPPATHEQGLILRNGKGRLGGSGEEIRRITAHLAAARSTVLEGFAASLAQLHKNNMDSFDILHFAAHGVEDRERVSGSGLVLSLFDAQGNSIDGFLSTRRIAAARLKATLVVLGACDTASGRVVADEGSIGVAYAFLQAGARHVVAALWPLDDSAMPELMDGFYADPALAAARPAQALRQAQRALLARYPQASPALWAGLAASGW
jgi:CHAT domain-containing protein/Tfp pilus assembly protein PilF